MTFDRIAYLNTIYATSSLDKGMLQVLVLMGTLCDEELYLRTRKLTRQQTADRLRCGVKPVRCAVERLEAAGLLKTVRRHHHKCHKLPTEDELARYIAPPLNPRRKLIHEKLARTAKVLSAKKVSHRGNDS